MWIRAGRQVVQLDDLTRRAGHANTAPAPSNESVANSAMGAAYTCGVAIGARRATCCTLTIEFLRHIFDAMQVT